MRTLPFQPANADPSQPEIPPALVWARLRALVQDLTCLLQMAEASQPARGDRRILQAITFQPMSGKQIAKAAGLRYNSRLRSVLSDLVQSGKAVYGPGGYRRGK